MSYTIVTNVAGQINFNPRVVRVLTQDTYENVTSSGYLTNTSLQEVLPTDIVLVKYLDGIGFFEPIFENGVITLSASAVIPDDSVGTAQLQDEAVTTEKIDDLAVDNEKLSDDSVTSSKIEDDAVTLAKLAPGITPSHIVFAAGEHTTVGGSTTETFSVSGVTTSDIAFVVAKVSGGVQIYSCDTGTGNISVVFSADPGTGAVISYQVLRAVS